ncbi:FCD domain-containing protein [Roseicitreum antarcticum]|uniref:FCD domain-containing protein n=2 Tax=Roseicitreum antarcticum TaxID=564137 RepID=A0A1H3ATN9_9RHOB|nr:FCD domain-containing protein [Roseicitreum antarcticum]
MESIRNAPEALREAIGRDDLGRDEDIAFHDRVAMTAGNEKFRTLLKTIGNPIAQTITIGLQLGRQKSDSLRQRVIEEHRPIAEPIAAGDREAATTVMRYHLFQARAGLVDMHHHMNPQSA